MKLNDRFIQHTIDGETVLIPTAGAPFHGLIQGNKSVAAILDCLQNDVTEKEIVDELCRRFNGDRGIIAADVTDVIARLKAIGAVDE